MKKLNNRGFTFIELLVVTTIILVISAIGALSYTQVSTSSRNTKRKTDLEAIRQALVIYRAENSCYPSTLSLSGYLSPVPTDPKTSAAYTYTPASCAGSCCASFTLSATLEPSGVYSVANP